MTRKKELKTEIIELLKENKKMRFVDFLEKTGKSKQALATTLSELLSEKVIEKFIDEDGKVKYRLSPNIEDEIIKEILISFIKEIPYANYDFLSIDPYPFIIFLNKKLNILEISNLRNFKNLDFLTIASSYIYENFQKLNIDSKIGIIKLVGSAYFLSIQKFLSSTEFLPSFKEFLLNEEKKLLASPEKEEKENVLNFINNLKTLLEKDNLLDFIDTLFELKKNVLYSEKIEKEFRRFFDFHEFILNEMPEDALFYPYFKNNLVWNKFYEKLFLFIRKCKIASEYYENRTPSELRRKEIKNIHEIAKTINKNDAGIILNENIKYINNLIELCENSKIILVSFWGIDLESFLEKSYIPLFELWFKALKERRLSHRKYLFSKATLAKIKEAYKDVKKGRKIVKQIKIDPKEIWDLAYLYFNHPRGKDPIFWEEIIKALEKNKIGDKNE